MVERQAEPEVPSYDDDTVVLSGITSGAFFADRYRVDDILGSGAMGKVLLATDVQDERPIALKVLHPDKARREHVLARFRREAQILTEIGHPGIVKVLAAGRSPDGTDYIAMELIEGCTLGERLREQGPMTPRELLPILVAIADALGAAHAKGVVHRDLKPDNVMLCEGGPVKVVDFGLSMLDVEDRMTKTGVMLGTPRYMAPEQIRSAKDVDPRVDVYSLGVITHEALTGESPFPAQGAAQLLGCVIEGRVTPIEEQRPDLPPGLGDVVRRAMAKDRGARYATIGAFVEAFARSIGVSVVRARQAAGAPLEESASDDVRPSAPVEIPPAPAPASFTQPDGRVSAPPVERSRSRVPLFVGLFVLALVAVACVGAALAFGVRHI